MINRREHILRANFFTAMFLFVCMTACNQTTMQLPTSNAPSNAPPNTLQNQIAVSTYRGTGVIESVEREKGRVTIKHEEIKGYMEAMTMSFKLKDPKSLDNLNIRDKIDFTLEDAAGIITIIEIRKR